MILFDGVFSSQWDSAGQATEEAPVEVEDIETKKETPARVVLFNDDWHTFDEVIGQLVKALGCGSDKAEAIAFEAHSRGKALVYEGSMPECLRVNGVLEEISLITQIEV
ncbi:MAG: ATP-dependent Clp protease adaptor ClpS [Bacteroidetes bacterium]|nr:ATP-dependent Clp protease adaptor ClpS [Bacteroidota bacterium]